MTSTSATSSYKPYKQAAYISSSSRVIAIAANVTTGEKATAILAKYQSYFRLSHIVVFNTNSVVIASSTGLDINNNISSKRYVQNALAGEGTQSLITSTEGAKLVATSSPIYNNGNIIGGLAIYKNVGKCK